MTRGKDSFKVTAYLVGRNFYAIIKRHIIFSGILTKSGYISSQRMSNQRCPVHFELQQVSESVLYY